MQTEMFEKIHRINDLVMETDALYHQLSVMIGVPDSIMRVMYTVHGQGGESCLLSDIYKRTGISKQTVNSAIRALEVQKVLSLEPYKGKAKRVVLTEKGKEYLDRTAGRMFAMECDAFDSWTKEEIDMYIHLTEKYLTDFSEQIGKVKKEKEDGK